MRNVLLAISIGLSGGVLAGGSGPDPLFSTPAGKLWQRVVPVFRREYTGRNRDQLPRLIAEGVAFMRDVCAPQYDPELCFEGIAVDALSQVVRDLDDKHTLVVSEYSDSEPDDQEFVDFLANYGFTLRRVAAGHLMVNVVTDSVAARSGFKKGDVLRAVRQVNSPSSTTFDYTISRSGKAITLPFDPSERDEDFNPKLPSFQVQNGVGILNIPSFRQKGTAQRVHSLVWEARKLGVTALVVDLRGNSGGLFEECVPAASAFVPDLQFGQRGAVNGDVRMKDARPQNALAMMGGVDQPTIFTGKLAVLVDTVTASCAEVFTALVQRAKRGAVYGEPTAGIANTNAVVVRISESASLYYPNLVSHFTPDQPLPERVTPNVSVRFDLDLLEREGRDAVLERALADLRR